MMAACLMVIPVVITVYSDRSFEFEIKSSPTSVLIAAALKVEKGSGRPNTDKIGKLDTKALAAAIHGATISAKDYPGVLMDVRYDAKGDIDRESFITEIRNGKTVVAETLPPMSKK